VICVVKTCDGKTYRFDTHERVFEVDDITQDYLAAVPIKIGQSIEIYLPTHKGSCEVAKTIYTATVTEIRRGEELDAAPVSKV
jgi:hypothetical protein